MKRYSSKVFLKKHLIANLVVLFSVLGFLSSCDPDKGAPLYTFTGKMMGQFIKDSTNFSEFAALLDTTETMGLLNAYGSITCFAPDNEAMKKFYLSKGRTTLADFTLDSLKIIAYNHIILDQAFMYASFKKDGSLPKTTMSDRYLTISFPNPTGLGKVNTSQIIEKDILVHNGVIHTINEVLDPTNSGIIKAIASDSLFSVFYQALNATGLAGLINPNTKDVSYDPNLYTDWAFPKGAGEFEPKIPTSRKYGYTVLMESNTTLKANGIIDLDGLKAYAKSVYDQVYPEDDNITDPTDRRNSLNRFIAYHIINKQLRYSNFIDAYDTDHMIKTSTLYNLYEYLEPMCPNTLIEIKKDRSLPSTFLINFLSRSGESIHLVKNIAGKYENDATNGVYYEIDGMLEYSKEVDDELSGKRLRFDAASFFPELTNNDMRGTPMHPSAISTSVLSNWEYLLPRGYIDRITSSETTSMYYLSPNDKYCDYQGDEIFLDPGRGNLYDFTVITPVVPKGTYEVRFGYGQNGNRDVAQLYFDDAACGVPLNLTKPGTDVSIGWVLPGSDLSDPQGYENDKMMRNRGYMKGPASFKPVKNGYDGNIESSRLASGKLRKILGIYTFTEAGNHTLRVTGLSAGQFMFDYLEFVPTSVLESEDIY